MKYAHASDIRSALQYAMAKVGIRGHNLPGKEETALLLSHIVKEYGGHTPHEIRLAFDLALGGKLELREVSCFENFSCLYFSKVMNAYRAWAREEYKQIKNELPMIEIKESLSDQAMYDWLQEMASRIRAGGYQVDFMPLALYEWLDKQGRILLTNAEKREYLTKAADYRLLKLAEELEWSNTETNRRQLAEFADMRRAGEFTGDQVIHLKSLAKKMVLFDMLQDPGQPKGQRDQNIHNNMLEMSPAT